MKTQSLLDAVSHESIWPSETQLHQYVRESTGVQEQQGCQKKQTTCWTDGWSYSVLCCDSFTKTKSQLWSHCWKQARNFHTGHIYSTNCSLTLNIGKTETVFPGKCWKGNDSATIAGVFLWRRATSQFGKKGSLFNSSVGLQFKAKRFFNFKGSVRTVSHSCSQWAERFKSRDPHHVTCCDLPQHHVLHCHDH